MRLALVLIGACLSFDAANAELIVSFESKEVLVRGVSPGGSVALLAVDREPHYLMPRVTYHRELLDDRDVDGSVTYALDREIPSTSVWVLVDVTTGSFSVAMPEDDVVTQVDFPIDDSIRDEPDGFVLVDDARTELELLFTRPRDSAWRCAASDGGPDDKDGAADGRLKVHLGDLLELAGGSRQLADVAPGDVIIGIDRYRGEYFVHTVGDPIGR